MKSDIEINGNCLRLKRIFQAPRPQVFSWWTTAEKLQQWSVCKEAVGCEVVMDFRVGGTFTQKMYLNVGGKACEYTVTGTYQEIVVPEKIVYQADFGHAVTRVVVEFFEHGAGTKLILTHEGCPNEFFSGNVSQGTSESFDKLDLLIGSPVTV